MNDNIVPIKPPDPHMTGMVKCLSCRHEWVAVRPVGMVWLDCPACSLHMGRSMGPVDYSEPQLVWNCNCGNDLFYLTKKAAECCVCGLSHTNIRF
jgi:hypothetical protein